MTKIERIIRQVRKWNLAVVSFRTPVVGEPGLAVFANTKSGMRGGCLKNVRRYSMTSGEMLEVFKATGVKLHSQAVA